MHLEEVKIRTKGSLHLWGIKDYFEVIKPRETGLLAFIGVMSAIVAGSGSIPTGRFFYILAAIFIASAGANGLTNYLDRDLDARMERTRHRALPSGRIYPPERALFFTAVLSTIGLIMAWYLHPLAFLVDLVGTAAAVIYRKKVTCVFPQGMIASCAPVLMGWFAIKPAVNSEILLLCLLIAVWLPSHIWSIMIAHKEDYQKAGITYFPLNCSVKTVSSILFAFCLVLFATSISLYFIGHFGWLYLAIANISGIILIYASLRLVLCNTYGNAWKLYKLSAFPYLGLIFLVMGLDVWLTHI
jgi:protoheme IX farnesyltransferase